jgi:type IVB pilus formation R64 PilN family outer membrane protein
MRNKQTLIPFIILTLAGCANTGLHKEAAVDIEGVDQKIQVFKTEQMSPGPTVYHLQYPPANLTPIAGQGDPAWYSEKRSVEINDLTFGVAVRKIFEGVPVSLGFDHDLDQNKLISTYNDGTLIEWLDTIALASGYAYKINSNHISWHQMMTATFDIMALPGEQNHLVGTSVETNEGSNDDEQTGSAVRTGATEYSNNTGASLSIWDDIREMVKKLVSEKGEAFVSEASTSVTVKDYPENVRTIERIISEFNDRMGGQVVLDVQIVSVRLNKEKADGIDWAAVRSKAGSTLSFGSGLADFVSAASGAPTTFGLTPSSTTSRYSGSKLLISALEGQGDVAVVTSPRAVTLNNQLAEIRINSDQSYLASSKTSVTDVGVETELIPGVVTDGFSMYVLPKINRKKEEVFLQFSTTISDLQALDTITSGGTSIQTPLLQSTRSNNRTKLKNGETLLISGYQQTLSNKKTAKNFGLGFLAQSATTSERVEILILITPQIMD